MVPFTPTDEQKAIIPAPATARLLVEAGPGTGKTEVVARRLAWLLGAGNLRPGDILVLSFSRSAVKALVARIRKVGEQARR
jgi:DNA helicase II / ATP-dependent DNA helicase PcrA